ncbi:MAG: hypothetical protein R3B83_02965 [Nitrospirales bacterium]|nr:hypothetical protein [Nitrospirales bacterium]
MWLITAEQMQALDRRTIKKPVFVGPVMERAEMESSPTSPQDMARPKDKPSALFAEKEQWRGWVESWQALFKKWGPQFLHTVLFASPKDLSPDAQTMYHGD